MCIFESINANSFFKIEEYFSSVSQTCRRIHTEKSELIKLKNPDHTIYRFSIHLCILNSVFP